jgi:hypothetical protein
VRKEGPNKGNRYLIIHTNLTFPLGKEFYGCPLGEKNGGCKFFKWADEIHKQSTTPAKQQNNTPTTNATRYQLPNVTVNESNVNILRAHGVKYYVDCEVVKR